MGYVRANLMGLTSRQRATWERKAADLQRRAGELMSEVMAVTGVEHPLTNEIDNVLHATEDLATALRPEKPRKAL